MARGGYAVLCWGALATLLSLALILWSFLDHRPLVLVFAMTVGQAVGTLSFVLFLLVVVADLRGAKALRSADDPASSATASPTPPDSGAGPPDSRYSGARDSGARLGYARTHGG